VCGSCALASGPAWPFLLSGRPLSPLCTQYAKELRPVVCLEPVLCTAQQQQTILAIALPSPHQGWLTWLHRLCIRAGFSKSWPSRDRHYHHPLPPIYGHRAIQAILAAHRGGGKGCRILPTRTPAHNNWQPIDGQNPNLAINPDSSDRA
jgi:hypothetical protein